MWDLFILFRSWVICKNVKRPGFYALVFYTFINNSRSKQNKKNLTHSFLLGVDAVLGHECGIWEHLQFHGSEMFPVLFQDFMDGYIKPEGSSH